MALQIYSPALIEMITEIPKAKKKRNIADAKIASSGASAFSNESIQSVHVHEANVVGYKLDVEEWKDNNNKKLRIAFILLA